MNDRPQCYGCIYRREVPGSEHSSCHHPATKTAHDNPLAELIAVAGGFPPIPVEGIRVVGHAHGIRMGWFSWPLNFDPNWLYECDGFAPKEIAP